MKMFINKKGIMSKEFLPSDTYSICGKCVHYVSKPEKIINF
jgi:hypothetical protein